MPFGILPVSQDEHALCTDGVRFIGDPVAAVAALDEDDRARGARRDRGRVRAAAGDRLDRRAARAARAAHPRLRRPGNIHKEVKLEFGDVDAGFARRRPCSRTSSSTRATPTCRSSSTPRSRDSARRQAHAVVLDADPALRPPRAREGPRDAGRAHPRHRDARTAAASAARATRSTTRSWSRKLAMMTGRPGEDLPHARGGLLLPSRPAPGADAGDAPASRRTARSPRMDFADVPRRRRATAPTGWRPPTTRARCRR